jgi:antitoxin Phd
MQRVWQIQEAKNKLSAVVDEALRSGPQVITRHGADVAVVISYAEYRQMMAAQGRLSDFFRVSPMAGLDLDLERDRSAVREDLVL